MDKKRNGCLIGCGIGCGGLLLICLCIVFIVCLFVLDDDDKYIPADIQIEGLRDYYTHIKGDGSDNVTVMMYMIGSDLETEDGAASSDIEEIINSSADNINITLQTGGAEDWWTDGIDGGTTQRHIINSGGISNTVNLGNTQMTNPVSLTDFIRWSAESYPANRYELILWNHGGGTVLGYGYDELYPDDMMSLSSIGEALKASGVKFDFVGFDACLMGTIETAYMLEPYSDYLIASEEYIPGTGWYYTDWLKTLSNNTSTPTIELGTKIIDDYIDGPDSSFWDMNTLSIVDLREIPYVYSKLGEFMNTSVQLIQSDKYNEISNARYNAKAFGDGEYEQIDIISYLERIEDSDSKAKLSEAIRSAVKYTNNSTYDASGLAMYFPYDYPEEYSDIMAENESFGYGEVCEDFFEAYLNVLAGGQMNFTLDNENEHADYNEYSWYTPDTDIDMESYDELEVIDKGDYYALSLSDAEWETINDVALQVFLDDGEGYLDLGLDNVSEFDDDGDLMVDFDYYWVSLNGQNVPFNYEYQTPSFAKEQYTYGYVPALLNDDEQIEIMIYWDERHTDGYVAGYRLYTGDENISVPQKGLKQFTNGDTLEFLCDYYTYDGDYEGTYSIGDTLTVNGEIEVGYEHIGDYTTVICYALTDIYNNVFTTELVELN